MCGPPFCFTELLYSVCINLSHKKTHTAIYKQATAWLDNKNIKMTREIKRVQMSKGSRVLTLQGVIHIADEKFFKKLEKEMADRASQGHVIFRESATAGAVPANTAQQEVFDSINTWMVELARLLASMHNMVYQEVMSYPSSVVVADMAGGEFLQKSAELGLNIRTMYPKKVWQGWDELTQSEKQERVRMYVYKKKNMQHILKLLFNGSLMAFRKLYLTQRSIAAGEVIEAAVFEKGYITYGNAHVTQIVRALRKKGWKVAEQKKEKIIAIRW